MKKSSTTPLAMAPPGAGHFETAGALLKAHSELVLAQTLHWAGQTSAALERSTRALSFGRETNDLRVCYQAQLHRAWLCAESGQTDEGLRALESALALGREQEFEGLQFYLNNEHIFARLCAWALEVGVEVEYTRSVIRERRLVPLFAAPVPEAWPLPLKIYTLGRFSMLLNDQPLKFTAKAQTKPLELLKALLAMGGRDVREAALAEALWPEADADAAAYSLTTTLHRLRMLVGPQALERQSGRISLRASHCWVDAWSFERQLSALERAHSARDLAETVRLTASLIARYRGAFLEREPEHTWLLARRERIHRRWMHLLEAVGSAHVVAGRYDLALSCLKKAVEIDPLAEAPYRNLMQMNLARGHFAEVVRTYQHCRKMLESGLGCVPSAETEALLRRARAG